MGITFYLNFSIILIALLASFSLYFQPSLEFYMKTFPFFMVITMSIGGLLSYLSIHAKSNGILYNLFAVFTICFYLFVIREIIHEKKVKKVIFWALVIYPILTICNIFLLQKITSLLSISISLGCLLIVAFCIYYFFELFQQAKAVNLTTQPSFWICSGLLFYYSCTFPFNFINLLNKPSPAIVNNLVKLSNILDAFLYLSFTIAFLCRIKIRRSTSSS
jgi:hypothetical protein